MPNNIQIVLSYALHDADLADQLTKQLANKNIEVLHGLQSIQIAPGDDPLDKRIVLLVIVTPAAEKSKKVLADIEFANANNWKILPVEVNDNYQSSLLLNLMPLNFYLLATSQFYQFLELSGLSPYFNLQAAAPAPQPKTSPPPRKSKNSIFKSIIKAINPFNQSKNKVEANAYETSGAAPDGNSEDDQSSEVVIYPQQPWPKKEAFAPKRPASKLAGATQPAAGKGKVLYDIPDKMIVNKPQKCLVRLGANEAIVRDDDTFSPSVKIEAIPIYKVMAVDMIDISDPPIFSIKCISTPDQIVEDDSYSEWIFMVTPLSSGTSTLFIKVSVVKIIDGVERRKELVFEKAVDITTTEAPANAGLLQTLIPGATPALANEFAKSLKDLLNEKTVKEVEPPVAFISYAHKDEPFFNIFADYLAMHSGWTIWTDRSIKIGSDWFEAIQDSIKEADIAVLLISAGFISSGFIKENEFKKFSDLQKQKPGLVFLPVLLGDVDFTRWEALAALQLFSAKGPDYGLPKAGNQLLPFAKLCRFDNDGVIIPNDYINTYFKNLVKKAEKDWLGSIK